jgi:ATP-dependent Clp protease protease subunit
MEQILSLHTGRDVSEIRKDIERDKILAGIEAVSYGICDMVIPSRKIASLIK